MYDNIEKIEDIDTIKMYKMIQALFKYDYYSTKCLVNEFIKKRTKKDEMENLEHIRNLIFYQKSEELESFLKKLIEAQEKIQKRNNHKNVKN